MTTSWTRLAVFSLSVLLACGGAPAESGSADQAGKGEGFETRLVENFEGRLPLSGAWRVDADEHGLGTTVSPLPFERLTEGSPVSPGGSAMIRGRLGRNEEPWAWVHLNVFLDSEFRPVDVGRFRTVEFSARGDGKTYAVMLHRRAVDDGDDFRHLFTAPAEWTRIRLPISAFAQGGWGTARPAAYDDVVAVRFGVLAHDEPFELWIDDIALSTRPSAEVAGGLAIVEGPAASPVGEAPLAGETVSPAGPVAGGATRIVLLHHSTGGVVYEAGLEAWFREHNASHGTAYAVSERAYPSDPYPWENYPYDYWNIWVNHAGAAPYRGQETLETLASRHDVVVWKHCFPVSDVGPDAGAPEISSDRKTVGNYRAQYLALREAMRRFPRTRFVVWTGAALTRAATNEAAALRARAFSEWVVREWDEPGDNVYVFDFRRLETEGGLYLLDRYAAGPDDPHPAPAFARRVAPLLGRRIVDVVEGRGDSGSLTGE